MVRGLAVLILACGFALPADASPVQHFGQLRVARAGRGQINLDSGQASFLIRGWELLPAADSNGIDPATEVVIVAIAEEQFLIPAGQMKASRKGKRFVYKSKTDRGIQLLKLARTPAGTIKVTLKIAGVDLSTLVISDPPICLSMAIIIGDDDGFSGVSFDRPRPFPSRLLTIPGFCTSNTEWPWA
jgi:hypothetical protein